MFLAAWYVSTTTMYVIITLYKNYTKGHMANDIKLCAIVFDTELVFSKNSMRPLFRISTIKIDSYSIGSHSAGRLSVSRVLLLCCITLISLRAPT